ESSASDVMVPQLAWGCGTPNPKKLRKASVKIAFGIVKVNVTIIGPSIFGIKCFHMIRVVLLPSDLAAITYSSVFKRYTSPRTIRAILIQPVIVMAIIMDQSPLGMITVNKTTTSK